MKAGDDLVDEIFFVDLPTVEERREILEIHLHRRGRKFFGPSDVASLAGLAEGFSGAEIEQAVVDGMFAAYAAGRELERADVASAIARTSPLSKTMEEEIKALRLWAQGRARPASIAATANASGPVRRPKALLGEPT